MLERIRKNLGRLATLKVVAEKESDKGLVLSLTSLIETTLQEIVFSFVVDNRFSDEMFGPSSVSPLSRRAKVACSLGLISEIELDTISHLAKVRNLFAHEWDISFESPDVARKMGALANSWLKFDVESNTRFRKKTDRELFQAIAFMLLTDLVHRADEVAKVKLTPVDWGRVTWANKFEI